MKNDKTELYQDAATGQMFRMSKEQMDNIIKETQKLLQNDSIKEAKIVTVQEFMDEFVNPYLPDDQKIVAGQPPWSRNNIDGLDGPFGIMCKF